MKKGLLFAVAALSATVSFADYRAVIFKNNVPLSQTKVSNIKSYTTAEKKLTQHTEDSSKSFDFVGVDSLVFFSDTVFVTYSEGAVSVQNPLAGLGVSVVADGANVTVSTDTTVFDMKDVVFALSGASTNGSFYMEQLKRTTLLFDNLTLHNNSKAVVAMSGNKGVTIELKGVNTLTDAPTRLGADLTTGDTTNAAIYVNDNLTFQGSGSLSVQGGYKHGVFVKDDMTVNGGVIVSAAQKAGFRVKDNFYLLNGSVVANSEAGSSIDVNDSIFVRGGALGATVVADDEKAITCDGGYLQSGGTVQVKVEGNGAKGIKVGSLDLGGSLSPGSMDISGGILNVAVGAVSKFVEDDGEESSPAGLKADGAIRISGTAQVEVTAPEGSSGVKGISADNDIYVSGASKVNVSVLSGSGKSWCYKTDGTIYVNKACVTTVCNEDNPKYDSDKSGTYKCAAFKYIDY